MKITPLHLALGLFFGAATAPAQITAYFDRSDWMSHVSVSYTDNFETYQAVNHSLSSVDLGPINYSNPNGQIWLLGPDVNYDAAYLSSSYLEWQNPGTITLDLGGSYTAIGFDFGQFYGVVKPFRAFLINAGDVATQSSADAYEFLGITSVTPFSSVTFEAPQYPLIDNLAIGSLNHSVTPPGTPVPEPSTYGMLGAAGAASLAIIRRRKRGPIRGIGNLTPGDALSGKLL